MLQKDLNVNPAKLVLIRSMDAVIVKAVRDLESSILPSLYYSKNTQTHFTIRNIKSTPMNYFYLLFPMKINKKSKKKFLSKNSIKMLVVPKCNHNDYLVKYDLKTDM